MKIAAGTRLPVTILMVIVCGVGVFGQQQTEGFGRHRLTLPNQNWSLDISLPRSSPVIEDLEGANSEFLMPYPVALLLGRPVPDRMANWSVKIQRAQSPGDETKLRESVISELVKEGLVDKRAVDRAVYNRIVVAKYAIDSSRPNDNPTQFSYLKRSKVLQAYLVKDDVWMTISFYASNLTPDDNKDFHAALDSIKITDTSAPSTSFDYYHKGRSHFHQKQYQRATEDLLMALNLEQKGQQLDSLDCRGLVQTVIKVYRETGDRTHLKEVLDFGVRTDPTYPGFHLLLARYYANLGDLDNTIASLEKAFLYKKNKDRFTQELPDPLHDAGFERFQKDERFRQAVKAMKK